MTKEQRELSTPSAGPVTWLVTQKGTGRSVVVSAKLWIEARTIGGLALNCDRYDVTCERAEEKK